MHCSYTFIHVCIRRCIHKFICSNTLLTIIKFTISFKYIKQEKLCALKSSLIRCSSYLHVGIAYRLASGGDNYGRIEIAIDAEWGTICDTMWDNSDAKVVCRQMGYADGRARRSSYYGGGAGPIWLDRMGCTGDETHLHTCQHQGLGVSSSSCRAHRRDAGVYCLQHGK